MPIDPKRELDKIRQWKRKTMIPVVSSPGDTTWYGKKQLPLLKARNDNILYQARLAERLKPPDKWKTAKDSMDVLNTKSMIEERNKPKPKQEFAPDRDYEKTATTNKFYRLMRVPPNKRSAEDQRFYNDYLAIQKSSTAETDPGAIAAKEALTLAGGLGEVTTAGRKVEGPAREIAGTRINQIDEALKMNMDVPTYLNTMSALSDSANVLAEKYRNSPMTVKEKLNRIDQELGGKLETVKRFRQLNASTQ